MQSVQAVVELYQAHLSRGMRVFPIDSVAILRRISDVTVVPHAAMQWHWEHGEVQRLFGVYVPIPWLRPQL